MKENQVKKLVMAAMCVALGIVLPMAFHTIQNAGSIFLPMHIPVLICGSALWMAVWADMWDFSACIIQSVYRNASGCNPSGNAL